MRMFERMDIAALTADQIAPLEAAMPKEWPDCWRDFATSQYITLISAPGSQSVPHQSLAQLAVALALGIAQDLGGTQPYIPVGAMIANSSKARRVIELLKQRQSYKQVADATGLTESRVRQIELEWRRQEVAARQGQLPLE